MENTNLVLGTNLQRILKSKKISQVKLANQLGVSASLVSGWILGRISMSSEHLVKICEILEVSPNDLLTNHNEATQEDKKNSGLGSLFASAISGVVGVLTAGVLIAGIISNSSEEKPEDKYLTSKQSTDGEVLRIEQSNVVDTNVDTATTFGIDNSPSTNRLQIDEKAFSQFMQKIGQMDSVKRKQYVQILDKTIQTKQQSLSEREKDILMTSVYTAASMMQIPSDQLKSTVQDVYSAIEKYALSDDTQRKDMEDFLNILL